MGIIACPVSDHGHICLPSQAPWTLLPVQSVTMVIYACPISHHGHICLSISHHGHICLSISHHGHICLSISHHGLYGLYSKSPWALLPVQSVTMGIIACPVSDHGHICLPLNLFYDSPLFGLLVYGFQHYPFSVLPPRC
ncbi:hypothetical protein RRG08_056614 [Elysia crispata]|uniref:Uncharacterized protein n=1 Tax=Elysia crispata TaxID=231223 RepID=A0AAE1B2R3_9GAST|nr:hypothetical protein RRG08_056614 [Elysia crispata]